MTIGEFISELVHPTNPVVLVTWLLVGIILGVLLRRLPPRR